VSGPQACERPVTAGRRENVNPINRSADSSVVLDFPKVAAIARRGAGGQWFLTVLACPFCSGRDPVRNGPGRHFHGGHVLDRPDSGTRVADCGGGTYDMVIVDDAAMVHELGLDAAQLYRAIKELRTLAAIERRFKLASGAIVSALNRAVEVTA
jgi:hypothetical protein